MSTNEDRQKLDFADQASNTSARSTESPTDLADSPVVKDPDAELSPRPACAATSRRIPARAMAQSGALPARGLDGEATMTRPEGGVNPGAPLNPGMGNIVGDVAGDGRLDQADIGDTPQAAHDPLPTGRIGATLSSTAGPRRPPTRRSAPTIRRRWQATAPLAAEARPPSAAAPEGQRVDRHAGSIHRQGQEAQRTRRCASCFLPGPSDRRRVAGHRQRFARPALRRIDRSGHPTRYPRPRSGRDSGSGPARHSARCRGRPAGACRPRPDEMGGIGIDAPATPADGYSPRGNRQRQRSRRRYPRGSRRYYRRRRDSSPRKVPGSRGRQTAPGASSTKLATAPRRSFWR